MHAQECLDLPGDPSDDTFVALRNIDIPAVISLSSMGVQGLGS